MSNESQPTPIPTASEMSEAFLSPRSPLFDIMNIRDISEVITEDIDTEPEKNEEEKLSDDEQESGSSRRFSDLIIKSVEALREVDSTEKKDESEVESKAEKVANKNPFHFNSSKLKTSDKSESEPKKSNTKTVGSNKKRNEILVSTASSVIDEVDPHDKPQASVQRISPDDDQENSDSDTIKEVVERKPRNRDGTGK